MQKIKILAIGTNEKIMETVLRLINQNSLWQGDIALSSETAGMMIRATNYDLILLGSGSDESEIRLILEDLRLNIPVVLHYGGGSGLLLCEINQALKPSSI
jgi:hypothetical protein